MRVEVALGAKVWVEATVVEWDGVGPCVVRVGGAEFYADSADLVGPSSERGATGGVEAAAAGCGPEGQTAEGPVVPVAVLREHRATLFSGGVTCTCVWLDGVPGSLKGTGSYEDWVDHQVEVAGQLGADEA